MSLNILYFKGKDTDGYFQPNIGIPDNLSNRNSPDLVLQKVDNPGNF